MKKDRGTIRTAGLTLSVLRVAASASGSGPWASCTAMVSKLSRLTKNLILKTSQLIAEDALEHYPKVRGFAPLVESRCPLVPHTAPSVELYVGMAQSSAPNAGRASISKRKVVWNVLSKLWWSV